MIRAVLMDLDGVLVDTRGLHRDALNRALKLSCDVTLSDEQVIAFEAMTTRDKLQALVNSGALSADVVDDVWLLKQDLTRKAIDEMLVFDSEKAEMHRWLKQSGMKTACVTNCIRETAMTMLKKTGQRDYINTVVSNQDVKNPKPCAEGYIVAMVALGVKPCECIIIEDSDKGLVAANATGANVFWVPNSPALTRESLEKFMRGLK